MKQTLCALCALAIGGTALAGPLQVRDVKGRMLNRIVAPLTTDSVNNQGKKFETEDMLKQKINFSSGAGYESLYATDSTGFCLPLVDAERFYAIQTSIIADQYAKGKIEISSQRPFAAFVDGEVLGAKSSVQDSISTESKMSKELTLEPSAMKQLTVKVLLSPDSQEHATINIAFLPDEHSENVNVSIAPDLKRRFLLAETDQGERVANASISPDGKYLMTRYSNRLKNQQVVSRTEITDIKTGAIVLQPAQNVSWLPTGGDMCYTVRSNDGYDAYQISLPTGKTELIASGLPKDNFYWSPNLDYILYYETAENQVSNSPLRRYLSPDDRIAGNRRRSFLQKYDVATGTEQTLTYGTQSTYLQDISADGSRILITVTKETPSKYPFYATTLLDVDLNTLMADTLVLDNGYVNSAIYSPDASKAFIVGSPRAFGAIGLNLDREPIPNDYDAQGYILDIATKQPTAVTRDFNPSIGQVKWNRANNQIYMRGIDGFVNRIYTVDPATLEIKLIPVDAETVDRFSIPSDDASNIAYIGQGTDYAGREYLLNLKSGKSRLLSDPFDETLRQVELGKTSRWDFTASDGTPIEGTMTLPPNFDPDKKYPLLVYYYGGTSPSQIGISHAYVPQLYASRGYVVYVLNPSGTYGYGQEFSARHVNAWGRRTADDIIEGVRAFVAGHDFVNGDRIGCFGASYGGFMTQYLLTQTDLFAAAISHAGISDVTSYWGEGYWGYSYNAVAAAESYPWTDPELFTKQGSLFNADKIHTPLLLLHGTADTNVPIGESIQIFNALKILGRDVEFISFDGQDHTSGSFPYDSRLLWNNTMMAWFAKHLQDDSRWWDDLYPQQHY